MSEPGLQPALCDARMRSGLSIVMVLIVGMACPWVFAQEDGPSLGQVARNLRQDKTQRDTAERPVIDNENLTQVLKDAEKPKPADKLVFSIDPTGKGFRIASSDVTCSLSFNGQAAALLLKPVLVEDLPVAGLLKLDGPASIQDDELQLEVFNGTEWELQEITVGLTLERHPGESAEVAAQARLVPAAMGINAAIEKHSDVTVLYHLKGSAKPFSTTTFRENIGATPAVDQDWRWSIVEARGIRPQEVQVPAGRLSPSPTLALPSPLAPKAQAPSNPSSEAADRALHVPQSSRPQ